MPRRCLATAATEQVYPYHEPEALSGHRRRLLHRASGRVLDLSPRWTRNRACYRPGAVDSLTVISAPSPFTRPPEWVDDPMLEQPEVLPGDVDTLAPPIAAFDTVVATMALCTVADLGATLTAVAGWLRPGGQLLVLEHVRGTGLTGLAQRAATPLQAALGSGCRLDQDLASALRRAGLDLTDAARFTAWLGAGVPTPYLAGVARRRGRPPAPSRPSPGPSRPTIGGGS